MAPMLPTVFIDLYPIAGHKTMHLHPGGFDAFWRHRRHLAIPNRPLWDNYSINGRFLYLFKK
jgi:hypothetical protein